VVTSAEVLLSVAPPSDDVAPFDEPLPHAASAAAAHTAEHAEAKQSGKPGGIRRRSCMTGSYSPTFEVALGDLA
jgi:hypothetical protein